MTGMIHDQPPLTFDEARNLLAFSDPAWNSPERAGRFLPGHDGVLHRAMEDLSPAESAAVRMIPGSEDPAAAYADATGIPREQAADVLSRALATMATGITPHERETYAAGVAPDWVGNEPLGGVRGIAAALSAAPTATVMPQVAVDVVAAGIGIAEEDVAATAAGTREVADLAEVGRWITLRDLVGRFGGYDEARVEDFLVTRHPDLSAEYPELEAQSPAAVLAASAGFDVRDRLLAAAGEWLAQDFEDLSLTPEEELLEATLRVFLGRPDDELQEDEPPVVERRSSGSAAGKSPQRLPERPSVVRHYKPPAGPNRGGGASQR